MTSPDAAPDPSLAALEMIEKDGFSPSETLTLRKWRRAVAELRGALEGAGAAERAWRERVPAAALRRAVALCRGAKSRSLVHAALRFLGNGAVRRLRGGTLADEITGASILWDNTAEVFRVEGGATSAANPTGRVRAVLSPRVEPAASTPTNPGALTPSRALGDKR
jgi:hypothetical protein